MHKENETRQNPVAWQWFLFCFALWLAVPCGLLAQDYGELSSGSTELIGQMAPPWSLRGWVNSKPLDIGKLQGKVVLLRFFSDNPVGAASLREWDRTYRDKGLAVIGLYTPQPTPTEVPAEQVERLASALGFTFPVGVDSGWETLNRYWLNRADAEMTAVTFLIDRKGIIRYIQPDGQYEKNSSNRAARKEFEKLDKQVQSLLKEEGTTERRN
ncbi:MAG: redoxin domain-containing protein [Acidobacteria bacterium]|nr:redoxin domain-containing protein [Acidobacteriota bacterium]